MPLPDTVRDAVLISTSELSGAGRKAAEVAAVAGESFGLAVVASLSSDDGVTELIERGLRARAGAGHRRVPARADARGALRRPPVDVPAQAAPRSSPRRSSAGAPSRDVAPHWLGAHAGERAREALLRAADDSRAVHAYCDAAGAYRQALELWPDERRRGRAAPPCWRTTPRAASSPAR